MKRIITLLCFFILLSCNKDETSPNDSDTELNLYFPPANSTEWDITTPESLNWDTETLDELRTFLSENKTRAFILLKDGKIVVEEYWGKTILNSAEFNKDAIWYWASAGKTLTSFLVGLAQEQGLLDINDKTSEYLGKGWSKVPSEKEDLIHIKHQLTMTTGLDYEVENADCTASECLQYKADAGTQWYYHNAPYTLLENVVSTAAKKNYNTFTDEKIETQIGMNGTWIASGNNNVYWSTARDAARFGLLLLNKGTWNDQPVMHDTTYYHSMVNSSQNLNPSYGYLCWLNGKSSIIIPGLPTSFKIPLSSNAPADLFAAIGKNAQFIEVVPSQNLVLVRMGEAPNNSLVPVIFHDDMWEKVNALIRE
ncbi:serine hydrolase [Prolixibacteraceae bacterium Z1-6]|uniref:Serine hydrolase n=1 Tax=Draconibacterium aestuarii TaxID=2998507 RepID=A0A9X3J8X2_9BACT|nr:serine hydrolase [Prolixibacteraceae bacterium Z1-6]